jgi:hypothetical protein
VACSRIHELSEVKVISKIEKLGYNDMLKIIDKIKNSEYIREAESKSVIEELENYMANYTEINLSNIFNKR